MYGIAKFADKTKFSRHIIKKLIEVGFLTPVNLGDKNCKYMFNESDIIKCNNLVTIDYIKEKTNMSYDIILTKFKDKKIIKGKLLFNKEQIDKFL